MQDMILVNRDPVWDELDDLIAEARHLGSMVAAGTQESSDANDRLLAMSAMIWRKVNASNQAALFELTIRDYYGKGIFAKTLAYFYGITEQKLKSNLFLSEAFKDMATALEFVVVNIENDLGPAFAPYINPDVCIQYVKRQEGVEGIVRAVRNKRNRDRRTEREAQQHNARALREAAEAAKSVEEHAEAKAAGMSVEAYRKKLETDTKQAALDAYNKRLADALRGLVTSNTPADNLYEDGLYLTFEGKSVKLTSKEIAKVVGFYAP